MCRHAALFIVICAENKLAAPKINSKRITGNFRECFLSVFQRALSAELSTVAYKRLARSRKVLYKKNVNRLPSCDLY